MTPIEQISNIERQAIEHWIACHGEARENGIILDPEFREDFDTVFSCWSQSKSRLWQLMGEKLILSKQIEVTLSDKVMRHRIERQLTGHKFLTNSYWTAMVYGYAYADTSIVRPDNFSARMRDLVDVQRLFTNEWNGNTFSIPTLDGKEIKVEKGTKIIRVLGKIAKAFNLEHFEEFRILHSQIMNDRIVRGEMCLSIHPLDYLTMSDNDLNWTSCMRFANLPRQLDEEHTVWGPGCYRIGTVEMMNSPYIIEAYVRHGTPMKMPDGSTWSNKKWRTLIFVGRNFISSIKSYPYQSSGLSREAVNWVRELAEKNCSWTYEGDNAIAWRYEEPITTQDHAFVNIEMGTDKMYNDFGECTWHYGFVRDGLTRHQDYAWDYNYSGVRTCLWCGKKEYDNDPENDELYGDFVICRDCVDVVKCRGCGVHLPRAGAKYLRHSISYCPVCFKQQVCVDIVTGEYRDRYEYSSYYLVDDDTDVLSNRTWNTAFPHIETHAFISGGRYSEQMARYFINQPHWEPINAWSGTPMFFRRSDCTPEGIALFENNNIADD